MMFVVRMDQYHFTYYFILIIITFDSLFRYDQCLKEDPKTNALLDTLHHFENIVIFLLFHCLSYLLLFKV